MQRLIVMPRKNITKKAKAYIRLLRLVSKRFYGIATYLVRARYRLVKILRRRFIKFLLKFIFNLWIKEVRNIDLLDLANPAIIAANHSSYLDFCFLEALVDQKAFFLGAESLKKEPFPLPWLIKYSKTIYVDRSNPSLKSFKDALYILKKSKTCIISFPEGTRSRTGELQEPKTGLVELALLANVPIIPVGIRGAYDILPPHRRIPRFKRCTINIGEKIYFDENNTELQNFLGGTISKKTKASRQKLAKFLMAKIAELL